MQNNSAIKNAFNNLKNQYKSRYDQLNEIHRKAMNELKQSMYENTKEKVMFKRYEKFDDIYTYEFHLYPQKLEDNQVIFKYCEKELSWIKKLCEASNAGKWVEIVNEWTNDEHVVLYFRYVKNDVRQTDKEYDKKHEIDITTWEVSFFSSTAIDYNKLKALEGKEIKIYDESCEAYPKKVTVEKVDLARWEVHFSKEIALGWYTYYHWAYWSRIIDIKLLATTKLYDVNYQPNYRLPEESDEFSAF